MRAITKLQINLSSVHALLWGIFFFLLGLCLSLVSYYTHLSILYYLSFYILVSAILLLFFYMGDDLKKALNSTLFAYIATLFIILLYFTQRMELHRFDFFIADASDYYLAGINAVTKGGDIGFFLPLTSAVSAVGFTLFGYEYGPLLIVILYSATIPLGYFLFRKLKLNAILSFIMSLLVVSSPLSIWFSKSTYSESIWQVQLLLLLVLSYKILDQERIPILSFLSLCLLMIVVPFTRGEASLLYGILVFLSVFHFWIYKHLKTSLLIVFSSLLLASSIYYTLGIRAHYLLKWQYARIVPEITEIQLMTILYGASICIFISIFLLEKVKKGFSALPLPAIITFLAILTKILIAYTYSAKKAAIAHTLLFKNALGFTNFLILNELGFAYQSFGLLLTIVIVIGLIILHIRAVKGDKLSLILVVLYAVFTLPFVMQGVHSKDVHEIFLYWGRYYFSIVMMVHLFSMGLSFKSIYEILTKFITHKKYKYGIFITLVFSLVFLSIETKLYTIVTNESYLTNSQKLMPWIKERVKHASLGVVYDENIKYELHHNRVYDVKILTYRTLPVAKIDIRNYQKVNSSNLNETLELTSSMKKNKFLLCLSQKPCLLNKNKFKEIDSISLPISWREHYGIHKKDKKIHQGELTQSIKHNTLLYATLFEVSSVKIVNTFKYNEEIIFSRSSKISTEILKKNWNYTNNYKGAFSLNSTVTLSIPHIRTEKHKLYSLVLKYLIFNASKEMPKKIKFILNNQILKEETIYKSSIRYSTIHISSTQLSKNKKDVLLQIEVIDDAVTKNMLPYSIYVESLKVIKSKE